MKRRILFMLFFILFTQSEVFLQNRNDFFPLSQGNSYIYKYNGRFTYNDLHYGYESVQDTGWIKYTVESFVQEDTVLTWNIKESDSIYTHHYKNLHNPEEHLDTCYWTAGAGYFKLRESLTGDHNLLCSSPFGIWDSPIYITGSPFSPSLYRYKDDNDSIMIDFDVLSSRTTVKLKRNTGVTSFHFYSNIGTNSTLSHDQKAVLIESNITSVHKEDIFMHEYFISQNYPNPFNPATTIRYSLAYPSHVTLKIYNLLGREVATLVNEEKPEGLHSAVWKADNIPSGIYFYELRAGNYVDKRKMILLR